MKCYFLDDFIMSSVQNNNTDMYRAVTIVPLKLSNTLRTGNFLQTQQLAVKVS